MWPEHESRIDYTVITIQESTGRVIVYGQRAETGLQAMRMTAHQVPDPNSTRIVCAIHGDVFVQAPGGESERAVPAYELLPAPAGKES